MTLFKSRFPKRRQIICLGPKISKGGGGNFKICSDEFILDILELQMKSTKKDLEHIFR